MKTLWSLYSCYIHQTRYPQTKPGSVAGYKNDPRSSLPADQPHRVTHKVPIRAPHLFLEKPEVFSPIINYTKKIGAGRLQGRLFRGFCYPATLPDMAVGSGSEAHTMITEYIGFCQRTPVPLLNIIQINLNYRLSDKLGFVA